MLDRQKKFADEYLVDYNGLQAAIRAGYSEKRADATAADLLKRPDVQEYIRNKQITLAKKLDISQERVLQEYARIAFSDIRKLYTENNGLKRITSLDDDAAGAIAGIEVQEFGDPDDGIVVTKKIKLWDKKGALDSICKVMGYNSPDKFSGEIKSDIDYSKLPDDVLLQILKTRRPDDQ